MTKTRNFSIFLIKSGKFIDDLFCDDSVFNEERSLEHFPEGALFYLIENEPRAPWWVEYFSLQDNLKQTLHGGVFVLPAGGRLFCICFGQVSHLIDDDAYEHDFGLRVTLNCVDPKKLKSTDTVVPGPSLRQKTQIPLEADLTYFDFDYESDVLKSLTGKVKEEFGEFFRHATGASNLRIGSPVSIGELESLCVKLLDLYKANDFEQIFPGLTNISPVKDPSLIVRLEAELLEALKSKSGAINLIVPDIINYHLNVYASFSGCGQSKLFDEVYIGRYYEYLYDSKQELQDVNIDILKKHYLCLADENETVSQRFCILKCFIFDTNVDGQVFHLRERQWYRVDQDFISEMKSYLDPLMGTRTLPEYKDKRESDFNQRVAQEVDKFACLDMTSISPIKANPIEPCDLYTVENNRRVFVHVKISTLSSALSHLFNQGISPVQMLRSDIRSQSKFKEILSEKAASHPDLVSMAADRFQDIEVCYAVVTKKSPTFRSDNFPLFSRISLMRAMKTLKSMNIEANYVFVKDASPSIPGKTKLRKTRQKKGSIPPF